MNNEYVDNLIWKIMDGMLGGGAVKKNERYLSVNLMTLAHIIDAEGQDSLDAKIVFERIAEHGWEDDPEDFSS